MNDMKKIRESLPNWRHTFFVAGLIIAAFVIGLLLGRGTIPPVSPVPTPTATFIPLPSPTPSPAPAGTVTAIPLPTATVAGTPTAQP